jgi:putative sterol carrier protein
MCTKTLSGVILCTVALFVVMSVIGAGSAQAQGALLAGAAKAKITPQGPVWMAGYDNNRRSIGVHDDLWARAVVLKSGDQMLAIASVDLLGFPNLYVQRVREMVKAVPADAIIIAATHVHSAPDVIGLWGPAEGQSGVDKGYVDFVIKTVAQVIEQAAAGMAPAALRYAAGDLPGVSKNIRAPESLDIGLAALQVAAEDGKPVATLVNFACHPEIMNNNYITADFPNWLYQRIEEKAGGVALYINGAQGGMVTANIENIYDKGKDNWDDAARIGNAIADKALEVLAATNAVPNPSIALRTTVLRAPLANKRFEAAIAAGVLPDVREDGNVKTEVAAGTIGRAEFATIPGEALPNIGLALKGSMTGEAKFIFGITQDELGYILLPQDYGTKLYEYETSMSVGPAMGSSLVETLRPMIEAANPQAPTGAAAAGSLDAWFNNELPKKFKPEVAGDLKAVYYFKVTGEGGGDYTVTIANRECKVEKVKAEKPDLTVTLAAPDMAAIVEGELDPTAAFMTGKLQIDGDIALAMKLADLFFSQ